MEDKKMTEKESLELITAMINRTRERYIGDGNILLMWGYLTVIVTALVWIMLFATHNPAWNWLWFAIGIVGGIATPIMARKSDRKSGVKSYSDKITSQIWTIVGLASVVATLFCFGFGLKGFNAWGMMFAIPLLIERSLSSLAVPSDCASGYSRSAALLATCACSSTGFYRCSWLPSPA